MRPVKTDQTFNLVIDVLTCVFGGLTAPRLCGRELQGALAPYDFLVSFASTLGEDTHLSKKNYFAICSSQERTTAVGILACSMVALLSFEHMKLHASYPAISKRPEVAFLRHLRNAAGHGNRFNFYRDSARKCFVDPKGVKWQSKAITRDLQDKPAFPDFFCAGDFAYLFEDISGLLAR